MELGMETIVLSYLGYAAIGVISGVLSGLLGIGGGVIAVPSLFFLFSWLQFPQAYEMHFAIGTSLAAMIFNTLSSTRAHDKKHAVLWPLVKKSAPGLILGGIIGAVLADDISSVVLEIFFGIFLCVIGVFFFRKMNAHVKPQAIPGHFFFSLIFFAIGLLSVILGLGGGTFSVPTLSAFRVPAKQAIGTSAAITCLMTTIGAIAFLILGLGEVHAPGSFGYINLSAFLIIGIVSLFFAPLGARLAHRLPDQILRRTFGVILVLTGISMLA